MFSLAQGEKLVKAAREAVVSKFESKHYTLNAFEEPLGVFVTIHSYPDNDLRGCIGFPEPLFPLRQSLAQAAVAAAFSDPRFRSLKKEELDKIIFEVSVLTKPERIKVKSAADYKKEIKVGRDGLIAESGGYRGLLLPQVAPEWGWDVEQFLSHTCDKAGLPFDSWKDIKTVNIYKFQAQIFKETKPKGKIVEAKDF
ncbi:TIGR00296 family protein [Candidatus Woesearchaeota archaeon]|nr:TIGR00296 family protein [Candidatus Woesearchaeota archaeon]